MAIEAKQKKCRAAIPREDDIARAVKMSAVRQKTAAGPAEPGSIHHQAALAGATISAGRTTESMSSRILI
jgi:hypothetical protein